MSSLKKHAQQGFTIVELLIVIVVIGILAALVITTYSGIQQKGRNTERTTDLKAIASQLEGYYASKGAYPASTQLGATGSVNTAFIGTDLKGLDKEALRDPKAAAAEYALVSGDTPTATRYSYISTQDDGTTACTAPAGDCTKFVLKAAQEGSTDLITVESLN